MVLGPTSPDKRPATGLKPGVAAEFAGLRARHRQPGNTGATEQTENTGVTEQKLTTS